MQHNDERPTTSGRPSLLSAEQQAEVDRQRILGGPDDNPTGPNGSKRKYSWLAAALVAVVAIGSGSAVWLAGESDAPIVLASHAALPATPAPAAPLASDPAPPLDNATPLLVDGGRPNPEADNVPTAAILEDMPALVAEIPTAQVKKTDEDELTRLLDQPPAEAVATIPVIAATQPAKPVAKPVVKAENKPVPALVKMADKAVAKKTVIAKAAQAKPAPKAAQARQERHPLAAAQTKKKNEVHPRAQVDSDVALLAALVAHSKANQPRRPAAAEKLRQCRALASASEAEACRVRVCASSAKKEAECKAPRIVKAPSGA